MKVHELSKPLTANALNESLGKNFGQKLRLESFTLSQLEDARNRLRTQLADVETNESLKLYITVTLTKKVSYSLTQLIKKLMREMNGLLKQRKTHKQILLNGLKVLTIRA